MRAVRDSPRARVVAAPAQPVEPGSREAVALVHAELRRRIICGEAAAGGELTQAGVAKAFGVSRGPVREAFRLLEREGLLEIERNRRALVTRLSAPDADRVYALRTVNEALALAVGVARFTETELDELDRLVTAVERAKTYGYEAWEDRHQRFHELLLVQGGDPMRAQLARWADHTERYRRAFVTGAGGWSLGAAEHARLAAACRGRDVATATTLLARHLSRAGLTLVATIDPGYEPVLLRAALRQVAGVTG